MFLLRTAFWLSVVVLLLPADKESGEPAPRVTAFEAIVATQAAVADMSQFCTRQPDVCETGGAAFHVFADKVKTGVGMISSYFSEEETSEKPIDVGDPLSPGDTEPAWRKPAGDESV